MLGGSINSASVIGPLGNVFHLYKGSFTAQPDPTFDIATKVPDRVKSFRVVSVASSNKRASKSSAVHRTGKPESLTVSSTGLRRKLRSLLDSSVHAHEDPEHFLGKLQSLLEPSMVSAMTEACNGAEGLVTALHFLWKSHKDSPTNSESLLSSMAGPAKRVGKQAFKHKSTILKVGERVAERTPTGIVLRAGLDAANEIASSDDESMMDHIATGLSVTVPVAEKELPKLGSIGRSIAAMAASSLHTVGAQAAVTANSAGEPASPAPESTFATECYVPGAHERAILAETALHGIMRLDKGVLKHHQIFDKIHQIIKPLAPTIARADPMLSSIMQPVIIKVALASLGPSAPSTDVSHDTPNTSEQTADAPQDTSTSVPQSPTAKAESLAFKTKIGVTMPNAPSYGNDPYETAPALTDTDEGSIADKPIKAFLKALTAANPELEEGLPDMVEEGMQVDEGAFAHATLFGLPLLLDGGLESEFYEEHTESAVPVTGLAHRAMLAEAALQVMLQLPVDVIKSLEMPDITPTVDAFNAEVDSDGHDESGQQPPSQLPQQIAMGAAAAGAIAGGIGSAASSIASFKSRSTTHDDKLKDQEQKERELQQKENEHELTKIAQNQDAHKNKMEPPHKDVKHWDSKGNIIDPKAGGGNGGHGGGGGGAAPRGSAATRGRGRGSGRGGPPRGGGRGGAPTAGEHHGPAEHEPPIEHHEPADHEHHEEHPSSSTGPSKVAPGKRSKPVVPVKPAGLTAAPKLPLHTKPAATKTPPKPKANEEEEKEKKAKEEEGKEKEAKEKEEKEKEEKGKEEKEKEEKEKEEKTKEEHEKEAKEKEEKEKEEHAKKAAPAVKPKKPDLTRPTKSSAAKKTTPAKASASGKKHGKAEGLLDDEAEFDDESQIAEDFLSGFADV